MYLYNVTNIIEDDLAQEWLRWMSQIHLPQIMETKKFISFRLLKVIDSPNEGQTFCVQYVVKNITDYQVYQKEFEPALQAQIKEKFANRAVAYHSLMEYID